MITSMNSSQSLYITLQGSQKILAMFVGVVALHYQQIHKVP